MMITDSVRRKLAPQCVKGQCRKGKCSVSLQGMSSQSYAIDMDHPKAPVGRHETRCDFLVVGGLSNSGDEWIAPLELKEGDVSASEVARQLQAGADIAHSLVPTGAQVSFRPVVASGKFHKAQQIRLRRNSNKICFRGQRFSAVRISCGDPLAPKLKQP